MKKRTPTMIQIEPVECGAVALGMILGYFGQFKPIEELRQICGTSRNGSVAINILRAARQLGLNAKGYRYELEELRSIPYPFIVFWEENHFLVVERITQKRVYLNDPARGHIKISIEEFKKSYSDISLIFEPTVDFKPERRAKRPLEKIRLILEGYSQTFVYLSTLYFLLLIPALILPAFAGFFVDELLIKQATINHFLVLSALIGAGLLTVCIKLLEGFFLAHLSAKLNTRLSCHVLWHLLHLPVRFFFQRHGPEIISRLDLTDSVVVFAQKVLRSTIQLILMIFYAILLFIYDPIIALVGVGIAGINLIAMYWVHERKLDISSIVKQVNAKKSVYSISAVQHMQTLKACGAEENFFARWGGVFAQTMNVKQKIAIQEIWLTALCIFSQVFALTAVFYLGGIYMQMGKMTAGGVLSSAILISLFLFPISQFVFVRPLTKALMVALSRLEDALSYPIDPPNASLVLNKQQVVVVDGMTFGYSTTDAPIFENISLSLNTEEFLAITGVKSSGKTTLARLISGAHHPWSGKIYRNHPTLLVDEHTFLFDATIENNLFFWDKAVAYKEMLQAAHDACIHAEILKRRRGYDERLLEDGANMSYSEGLRLGLARALTLNPRCIILDSLLDSLDEQLTEQIVRNLKKRGCSCILITNRKEIIEQCDRRIILGGDLTKPRIIK